MEAAKQKSLMDMTRVTAPSSPFPEGAPPGAAAEPRLHAVQAELRMAELSTHDGRDDAQRGVSRFEAWPLAHLRGGRTGQELLLHARSSVTGRGWDEPSRSR